MESIEIKSISKIAELQMSIEEKDRKILDLEETIRNITAENARLSEQLRDINEKAQV